MLRLRVVVVLLLMLTTELLVLKVSLLVRSQVVICYCCETWAR